MLYSLYLQAERAYILNDLSRTRCDKCILSGQLVRGKHVLKQAQSPSIAFYKIIGLCDKHYIGLENIYKDLGWVIL